VGAVIATIYLGVDDVLYRYEQTAVGKNGKPLKKMRKVEGSETTYEVAKRLEEKYKVMEHFFEDEEEFIAKSLTDSMEKALEAILSGAPATFDPFGRAASLIQDRFKQYLFLKKLDFRVDGVPTQASLDGVNHRMAHPYAKRDPRPSFIDTGNYETHFRVWVE
jgi:hypothetical protein